MNSLNTPFHSKASHRSALWLALGVASVVGLLLTGCSSSRPKGSAEPDERTAATTNRRDTRSSTYVIQRGDQVQLTVFGYPEFNTNAVVKESGMISIPLVGEFRAAGLTREQLTNQLVVKMGEYVKSKVVPSVTIVGAMAYRVVVLGSVGNQGSFELSAPASVFQVLAMAGGPAKDADVSHVRLMRRADPANATELDLSGYMGAEGQQNVEGAEDLPLVNPGDMILVPKVENVVRDFGDLIRDVVLLFSIFIIID
jgi:polysaccharide biosynthesis/export protein